MSDASQPFNLLRSFSLLSLLCISLITLVSAFLLTRLLTQNILERDTVITMQFVQSTVQSLHPSMYFENGVTQQRQALYEDFFARENRQRVKQAFEEFFKRLVLMPEVLRSNVYGRDGTIIWSSHLPLVGQRFTDNPELQRALSGKLTIETGKAEEHSKAEHMSFKNHFPYFVESYIPIWNTQGDAVVGVVEVYKIPETLFRAIARGNRLVWGSAVVGGLFLYGTLFWIVRRGAQLIHRQHAQLVEIETLVAVGEMASAIAHKLRNPLASIRSSAELMLDADASSLSQQTATDIVAEADRLEHWIRDLLVYARPAPHTPIPTSLPTVLQDMLPQFNKDLARCQVNLLLEAAEALPRVRVDPLLLQQTLHSLLVNALDAMPAGGTLTITAQRTTDGRYVSLRISDTGHGIPQDHLAKVFKPFFTTKHKGLGVGLALAKRIVERHGGTITLSSVEGHGTTVSLSLPLAE